MRKPRLSKKTCKGAKGKKGDKQKKESLGSRKIREGLGGKKEKKKGDLSSQASSPHEKLWQPTMSHQRSVSAANDVRLLRQPTMCRTAPLQ